MSETVSQVIQTITVTVEILLYAGYLAFFLGEVYCKKAERRKGRLIAFLSYCTLYAVKFTIFNIPSWLVYVVLFFMIKVFVKKNDSGKYLAFLIVTWYSVQNLAFSIFNSISEEIWSVLYRHLGQGDEIYLAAAMLCIVCMAGRVLVIWTALEYIRKKIGGLFGNIKLSEFCYLIFMPAAGILFNQTIGKILAVVKEDPYFGRYNEFSMLFWLVPILAAAFYISIILAISLYSNVQVLTEERKNRFVEKQQVLVLKNKIKEAEHFYQNTRKLKHELNQHAINIQGLLEGENYGELREYVRKMGQDVQRFDFQIKSGNAVTDVILNEAREKAKQAGIGFEVSFHYDSSMGIEAYDMGIVLSNLVTNALEACKDLRMEDRRICILGRKKRKVFLLEVKNHFNGIIKFNAETGLPISAKEGDDSLHGIGLENVSKVAEKYFGSVDIEVTEQMFCVTVMFQSTVAL
ncbi:MAG: GHKL domain-containing protein [Lachnospiraceae bacterium]|nr:GHKL domain-containing protein [Lachnospiraceae bacterium]